MKTKTTAAFRRLGLVLLGLLLGCSAYLLNAKLVAGNQLPMPFGRGLAVVQSGSMEPTLHRGDLLLVKECPGYAVGDVVVYQSEGMLVVHRIIAVGGDTVVARGDANNAPDQPFDRALIRGRVVGKLPGVGYAVDFLKTPGGIFLLTLSALLLAELSCRQEQRAARRQQSRRSQRLREEIDSLRRELEQQKP